MAPKLRGYLLTYIACFMVVAIGITLSYHQASGVLHQSTGDAPIATNSSSDEIFSGLISGAIGLVFALFVAIVTYIAITVTVSPILTFIFLRFAHLRALLTSLFVLLFAILGPIIVGLTIILTHSQTLVEIVGLLWLLVTPFLAHYVALQLETNKRQL